MECHSPYFVRKGELNCLILSIFSAEYSYSDGIFIGSSGASESEDIMCGIIGIVGIAPVTSRLVSTLKRLEYRGYDSAGVATVSEKGLERRRSVGKIASLEDKLRSEPLHGFTGIGHTRWATHGVANETNAHPHFCDGVGVVHNGIIENYSALKEDLATKGYQFQTDTDTETVAVLLSSLIKSGMEPQEAVAACLPKLTGAYALGMIFEGYPELMIGARKGSPLVVGVGKDEMFLGSDALAIAPFTKKVIYLEEGDWCCLARDSYQIFDASNAKVTREVHTVEVHDGGADKGNYPHFMLKEIYEQPRSIHRTRQVFTHPVHNTVDLPHEIQNTIDFNTIGSIQMVSCGTAHYATRVAEYWFEQLAGIPCKTDIASEFRYREPALPKNSLAIFVSQSGETADTLAALRYCKEAGVKTLAVVNVKTSTIAREADYVVPTMAGPEIGVASTKAFTAQLMALLATAISAGRSRSLISDDDYQHYNAEIGKLESLIEKTLKLDSQIRSVTELLSEADDVFYLGRGVHYPLALEGALKLKEISYIHAEGFASGELKHGPIALITDKTPIVFVAPHDKLYEKSLSNLQEVAARRGPVLLLSDEKGIRDAGSAPTTCLEVPSCDPLVAPFVYSVVLQLIAYHAAVMRGTDVDQPRNLAKSVTVE